jgi:carbamoyl-phosphate synthase large subunit
MLSVNGRDRILIAGVGGASLGSELAKCLARAGRYDVFGCDISALAAGLYGGWFVETFLVDRDRYVESVRDLCRRLSVACVVPGGEEPARLLGHAAAELQQAGVRVAANNVAVVATCADKGALVGRLTALGLPVPRSVVADSAESLRGMVYPCIVKPATGSGGSASVFLAEDAAQAAVYVTYLLADGQRPLVQEYLPLDGGEFTVGVLSLPSGRLVGSLALRRLFHAKLSVAARTRAGLVSSGYSQGRIEEFADIRAQAERIATALGSTGPLNVQGRVRNGVLVPFEINARFSASTYLRALAGFNEVDLYLQALLHGAELTPEPLRTGYYLRDLSEVYVDDSMVKR